MDDIRELRKWLNEEPNRPIDRPALARLLERLEAAERDAERYRWLRDQSPNEWELRVDGLPCWKHDLDTAIDSEISDAAMKKEPQQ
jgi:hypothetical protein